MIDAAQASMIWCVGRGAQEADSTANPARATAANGDPGRVFAVTAHAYHNVATSSRKRAGAAVIDNTMAERMVACGWIAATIAGLATLVISLTASFGLTHYNLVDAGLLLGLAYGIYRRSRTCAVLALAYHILNRTVLFMRMSDLPPITIVLTLIFATLYVLGVIGTFVHHARRRAA
jgi:hypothetical protein